MDGFIGRLEESLSTGRFIDEGTGRIGGWFCTYTPEEVLIAAGLEPRRLLGRTRSAEFADAYLASNLCPYVRSCLDEVLGGESGGVECVVMATSCNAMCHLYNAWKRYAGTSFCYVLDVPRSRDSAACAYFESEIRGLVGALERHLGVHITDGDLLQAYRVCEEVRAQLRRLYDLRKNPVPPISGSEAMGIVRMAMSSPKKEFVRFLSSRLDRIEASIRDEGGGTNVAFGSRPRVLLAGSLCEVPLVELIEESGALVVYDDMCVGSRYFMDEFEGPVVDEEPGDPIKAIARRCLAKMPCARMADSAVRLEHLERRIEEFRVQGVIFYALKFCDNYLYEYPVWKERLSKLGVPVLFLEGDYIMGGIEQVRTRVSAFVEMLGGEVG